MTIRDIAVAFGFNVDQKSVDTAENTIKNVKNFAKKALGTIAIGFSFSALNSIAEEFNNINDGIKAATKEMGDQEEIQQKILKAANDTKSSYSDMAGFVTQLVKQDKSVFGDLKTATQFASLTTKVLKTAGRADAEVSSAQTMLNKAFAEGAMSGATFTKMLKSYPEMINTMADGLGVTKDQLSAMADAGKLTSKTLVNAFSGAADIINSDFDELDYSISDAMTTIRNSWGVFVNDLWVGSGVTNGVGKMMVRAFNGFLDVLKKSQPYIERVMRFLLRGVQRAMDLISRVGAFIGRLVSRIGGVENALKLISIVAGAIWLALNANKILSFLNMAKTLLSAVNLKVLAIIAIIVILALIIEDFINFMRGNDSVIGSLFDKAGIGADKARETILKAWNAVKDFLPIILSCVKHFWSSLVGILSGFLDIIKGIVKFILSVLAGDWQGAWEAIQQIFMGIWKVIVSFLEGLIPGITTAVGNIKNTIVNGIRDAVDWIKSLPAEARQWGADIIIGIADGIKGAISKVTDAVSGVADKIRSFLHFSVPDEGPLTDFQSWMPDFMSELAFGIGENEDTVLEKVKSLASGISTLIKGATATAATAAGGAVSKTSNTTNVTQNNTFNNSYSGNDTQSQKNISKGMNRSAQDATYYMAKGLAYAR